MKRLLDAFHELHEARFGFRLADHIEIVNFLVTGIAKTGQLGFPEIASAKVDAKPVTRRPVWFADGWIDTPVYARVRAVLPTATMQSARSTAIVRISRLRFLKTAFLGMWRNSGWSTAQAVPANSAAACR